MTDDRNPIEWVSDITEFNDLHDFMQDPELDRALNIVLKLIVKNDVPPQAAAKVIVELQALSTKFALLAALYSTLKKSPAGTPNNNKKNIYYSTKEALDKLVDALKYSARLGS